MARIERFPFILKAYKYAWYVLDGEDAGAINAVIEAYNRVDRWLYIQERNREGDNPTKPRFEEVDTFQFLLLMSLEPAEKEHERRWRAKNELLDEKLMILRYLKCVIYNSINHRPYYLAVGFGSLLYGFDWKEAQQLHNIVIQDYDFSKDWNKKNERLRNLKEALIERFGEELLPYITDGNKKKEFSYREDGENWFALTQEYLALHVPWLSSERHFVPINPASVEKGIPDLKEISSWRRGKNRQELEMRVWRNRSHALIDPICFSRLIKILNLDPLESKLRIPKFSHASSDDQGNTTGKKTDPDSLPSGFYEQLLTSREDQRSRRQNLESRVLSIVVDGIEQSKTFNLEENRIFSFTVPANSRTVELFSYDEMGRILLALLSLDFYRDDLEQGNDLSFVTCDNTGQKVKMTINSQVNGEGKVVGYEIETVLTEASFLHWIVSPFFSIKQILAEIFAFRKWNIVLGSTVIAIVFGLAFLYFNNKPELKKVEINQNPNFKPTSNNGLSTDDHNQNNQREQLPLLVEEKKDKSSQKIANMTERKSLPRKKALNSQSEREAQLARFVINDNGRLIILETNEFSGKNQIVGGDLYSSQSRDDILTALAKKGMTLPTTIVTPAEQVDASLSPGSGIKPIIIESPNGEVLRTQTPTLRWKADGVIRNYLIKVYDDAVDKRSRKPVLQIRVSAEDKWELNQPLELGRTYLWQIFNVPSDESLQDKPLAVGEGRFKIIGKSDLEQISEAEQIKPRSHLLLGVLYAKAGLLTEAEGEFNLLLENNKESVIVRNLLKKVRKTRQQVK